MAKLLIVVDYQNDFVDGALGFPKALAIAPYIVTQIEAYEQAGDEVVFTQDIHSQNYLETIEGKRLPVPHCLEHTHGADFHPSILAYKKKHRVFQKNTFGSSTLFNYLLDHRFDEIRLLGVVSNICVISNAVLAKSAQPDTPIVVDSKGSASFDETLEQKGYDILRNLHIDIL